MFKYYKKDKMMSLNRGETAEFNVILPIKDENSYIRYSDGQNIYWYDQDNETLYDENYKKTRIALNTLTIQLNTFASGDVIRFKVFKNKECHCVEIQKDFKAEEGATGVMVSLTSDDTTIGEIINEYVDYWYEIELNPDTNSKTIVGFDSKGAKIFRLFPEGGAKE